MVEIPQLLAGAFSGLAIYAAGYISGRTNRKVKRVEAVCDCKHSIGYHKDMTGVCNETVRVPVHESGMFVGYDYLPCGCLHYSGPELISSFTMRPIAQLPAVDKIPDDQA